MQQWKTVCNGEKIGLKKTVAGIHLNHLHGKNTCSNTALFLQTNKQQSSCLKQENVNLPRKNNLKILDWGCPRCSAQQYRIYYALCLLINKAV